MANDEELAEQMAEQLADQDASDPTMPLDEWSPAVEAGAALYDRMGNLIAVQIAKTGAKAPEIAPYPRPVTAMQRATDRARQAKRQKVYKSLVDRIVVKQE